MSTYRKERIEWTHARYTDKRHVRSKSGHVYLTRTVKRTTKYVGDFVVTIDEAAIIAYMVSRCANTKGGKSVMQDGLITCKRTRLETLSEHGEQLPLGDGESYVDAGVQS